MEENKKIDEGGQVYPNPNPGSLIYPEQGITRRNQLIDGLVCNISAVVFANATKEDNQELIDATLEGVMLAAVRIADLTIAASKVGKE